MKKLSLLLTLLLIVFSISGCSNQATSTDDSSTAKALIDEVEKEYKNDKIQYYSKNNEWTYNVYSNFVELLTYSGLDQDLIIPASLEGLPVRILGNKCFSLMTGTTLKLKTVHIPENIAIVGENCFGGQYELTSVSIDSTSKGISFKSGAFYNCKKLTDESVDIILKLTFNTVPSSMFEGCSTITKITIPANISEINNRAFSCESISYFDFGMVSKIDNPLGFYCNTIETIYIRNNKCEITKLAERLNDGNFIIYGNKDSTAEKYAAQNRIIFKEITQ